MLLEALTPSPGLCFSIFKRGEVDLTVHQAKIPIYSTPLDLVLIFVANLFIFYFN